MATLNKLFLIGNLGRDVELSYAQSGQAIGKFSLATTDPTKEKKTQWHQIVSFGKTAESAASYLTKGSQCYVEGSVDYQEWEGKDGTKKQKTVVVAGTIQFLDRRPAEKKEDVPF